MAKYHNKVYSFQKVNGGKQHEGVLAQDKSSKTKTRRAAVLWLVLCLLFSIWFWLFNNYNRAAVRDLTIPVEVQGATQLENERALALFDQNLTQVVVHVTGKNSDVSALDEASLSATVDLSSYKGQAGQVTLPIQLSISDHGDFKVECYPSEMTFTLDRLQHREVPVSLRIAEGVNVTGYQVSPVGDYINLSGPESEIKQISRVDLVLTAKDFEEGKTSGFRSLTPTFLGYYGEELKEMHYVTYRAEQAMVRISPASDADAGS